MGAARLLAEMRRDISCVLNRDPAARSKTEVALLYSGLHSEPCCSQALAKQMLPKIPRKLENY